jgi:hypothetical protein
MSSVDEVLSFAFHEWKSSDDVAFAVSHIDTRELKQIKQAARKLLKIIEREFVTRELRQLEEE